LPFLSWVEVKEVGLSTRYHQMTRISEREAPSPISALGTNEEDNCTSFGDNVIKKRRRLTSSEAHYLNEQFTRSPRPGQAAREAIAAKLGMCPKVIQIWFQNRRAKQRRDDAAARRGPSLIFSRTKQQDIKTQQFLMGSFCPSPTDELSFYDRIFGSCDSMNGTAFCNASAYNPPALKACDQPPNQHQFTRNTFPMTNEQAILDDISKHMGNVLNANGFEDGQMSPLLFTPPVSALTSSSDSTKGTLRYTNQAVSASTENMHTADKESEVCFDWLDSNIFNNE
jgi:hypothetical protein